MGVLTFFHFFVTFDIYKIGALRLMKQLLSSNDDIFKVHPKYFMISHPETFNFKYFNNPIYATIGTSYLIFLLNTNKN